MRHLWLLVALVLGCDDPTAPGGPEDEQTPDPKPALQCGGAQVCGLGTSFVKIDDPNFRPPGVVDWWEISIQLWNDGPTCAASVEGRANVTAPSTYHTFRSGRDGPEPLPVGASTVKVGTTNPARLAIQSLQIVAWSPAGCG